MKRVFSAAWPGVLALLVGCANLSSTGYYPGYLLAEWVSTDVDGCSTAIADADGVDHPGMNPERIRLVTWNVKKGSLLGWEDDFSRLSTDGDLMLVQEAPWTPAFYATFGFGEENAFAPGYANDILQTGVATLSPHTPIAECALSNLEPWLRTPKATSITKYALADTDKTLVVVNMHGVNFSWGTRELENQLKQIEQVVSSHDGPVIVSGDMNTWSDEREQLLDTYISRMQLSAVDFDEDHRVRAFGRVLDHIFVRDLEVSHRSTELVESSDHNPLLAEFRVL